ncbi:Protein NDNF [Trichinella pseudospiralis]|uniref:Protein NDNF n=1 Tax=Trichinella pseudospiralis TaxID=6337 RepID=A0A0V1FH27_TRIPS|nr:Protein NDNF [Trichinella pseudospiralis]
MLYTRLLFSLCVVTCLTSVSHLQRVKVGRCPELPARYLTNQLQHDRCRDDYDCDSTMKCCESIIGKVCMMPKDYDQKEVCKQPYTKWDSCGGGCMTTCYNIGWQQPCRQSCQPGCTCISGFVRLYLHPYAPCVPQIHCPNQRTTRKKFGVCPTLPQGAEIDYHRRRDRCGTDFDCSGTCPDGQKTSIFCDERDSCPWGYTCRSGLCCPNAPWQSPTATWPGQVTTAAGNCPHYAYIGTWAQLAPSCFTNSNCAYNQLCCYTYYGNRCIQVSQSEAHHQKTIDPNHQKIPCGGAVRWKLTNLPVSTVKNKPTLSFYIGKQNYMTNRLYDNVFKEPHYPDSWYEDEETLYKNAGEKQMNYVSKTASMLHVRLYLTGLRRICKVEIRFGTTPVEKHLFFQLFHLTQPKIDNIQSKSVTLSWQPSMSALLYTGGRLVYVIALSTVRPFATLCDLETDLKLDRVNLLEHRRQEHVAHRLIPQHHSGAVRSLTVLDATGPAKLQLISLQQNTNYYANVFALDLNTGENIAYDTVSFTTTSENQISQHRLVSSLTEAQLQTGYLGPSRVAFKVYQFSAPVAISELYILIQPCTGPLQAAIYQDGQKTLHYSIEELQAINLTGVNVGIVQIQIANDDNQAKIFNIWASNNYSAYPYPKLPYDTSITVTERKCDSVQLSWLASTDAHVYCLYKRVQRFDYFKQLTLEDWNLCQQPDENLQPLFCNQFRGNQYRNEILIQEIAALKPATTYRFDLFVSKHNQPSLAYRTVWISNSSAYNKMDVKNLATVFVPCIFRESAKARPVKHGQALLDELAASKSDIALKVDVLEMLIQNADSIGVLSEQERAILAAESSDKLNDDLNILKRSAKKAASKVLVRSRNSLSGNRNSQIYRRSVQPKLKSAESIERHERIKGSRITEPYKRRSVCSLEKSQGLSDKGENAIIRQNRCLQEKHVKPMRSSMFETIYSSAFTEGISTSSVIEEQCTTSPILRTSSLPDRKVISTENRECLKVNKAEGELVRAEPVQTVLRGTTVQFMSSDNELQDAYSKQSCLYEELSSALDNFAKTINVGLKSPVERMEVCCTEVELLHAEEEEDKTKKNDAKGKEARLPRCISAPVESVPQAGGTFAKKRNTSLGASKLRRGMPNSLKSGLREPKTPFSSPLKNQQQANIKASSNNMDKNNSVVVAVEQPERNLEIESKENIIQTTKVSSTNMDIVEDDEFKDSDMKKQIILQQINPDDDDNHPASEVGFCIRPSVNFIREHRKGHVRSKIQEFTDRESRLEFVGEETDSSSVIGQSPAEISKRTTTSKPTATRKPSSSSGNKGCSLNIKFSACF